MQPDDPLSRNLYRLRDWTYDNYPTAYLLGTGIILYSLTFPNLQAFVGCYALAIVLGLLLEPCVNPFSQRYGRSLIKGNPDQGLQVALTFDDGPGPETPAILEILRRHEVRATFFCVGRQVKQYPEQIFRIASEGHQLGNHTMTHANLMTASLETTRRELEETRNLLQDISGTQVDAVRPPMGYRAPWTGLILRERGEESVLWSINPRDFQNPGAEVIVTRVMSQIHPGAIVLLHDGFANRQQTVQALEQLIPKLKEEGYRFVTVAEMRS